MFIHQFVTSLTVGFLADMTGETIDAFITFDIAVCSLLFVEILLTLRTGYIVNETYEIVLHPEAIAKKYLRAFMIADLINCIPFVLLVKIFKFAQIDVDGTKYIKGEAIIYMCCLFAFSLYRFNRISFYFSSVPLMLKLSEKRTIILMLCFRTIY